MTDLRAAVEGFRAAVDPLDEDAAAVLDRLVCDHWAVLVLPAFRAVAATEWPVLIRDCVLAEQEARKHKCIAGWARQIKEGTPKAEAALELVAKHLERAGYSAAFDDPAREALSLVRVSIGNAKRDAERAIKYRGRKTNKSAAQYAGIGWLAEAMQSLAPDTQNLRQLIADLASAVLNRTELVTEDDVRHASGPRVRRRRSLYSGRMILHYTNSH